MGSESKEKAPPRSESMEILESGDENPERGNWTGKLDFLLSCLGYAVGLGNVWRFPYLCFKHGGGAFLIPYAIMLIFIGIPCFLLEITIGQYSAMGPVTVYSNLSPLFKGLGFANFLASAFVGLYYNMIIAWTIYYMFASFTSKLPWDGCSNEFNTEYCFNINAFKECVHLRENGTYDEKTIYHNGKCLTEQAEWTIIEANLTKYYGCEYTDPLNPDITEPGMYVNTTSCQPISGGAGVDDLFDIPLKIRKTAADEYLTKSVLNESDGIENMGEVQWHLALCLLAAWIVIFLCLIKGIKSSGKVVYFTATFPYFVLVILLIKAVTLDGAYDGIKFYIVPDFSRLSDISVWEGAAVQIFFSLSVAGGGLITLSSYNKFHNNVVRDTMIVCFGNCLTSVFAGFAIFSVLGFMAKELGVEVKDVAVGGAGLAFVAYPDLVTRFPVSPLWAILFFAMLFTLGLDSQFAIVETVLTGILDFEPRLRSKKTYVVGVVCLIGFICGLPLTTRGGSYLLDLLDYYAAGWPYLFIGLTELIIVCYVYGIQNYMDDLYHIMRFSPGLWAKSHFCFIYMSLSPIIIFVILIFSWSSYTPMTRGTYIYPDWANGVGWTIAMVAILSVPIVAIAQMIIKWFHEYDDLPASERFWKIKEDLLHHTLEWRKNADRAKLRDTNANGTSGFDNFAMTTMDDQNSKL